MNGPYIVTTKRQGSEFNVVAASEGRQAWSERILSRCAVATLDEVQKHVRDMWWRVPNFDMEKFRVWIKRMPTPEAFTLPDGTVIEVERRGWEVFGWNHTEPPLPDQAQRILDAYNAQQKVTS